MAASSSTKKGCGCGCGGGGSSSPMAAPCSCGGASCSLCQDQGFVRPRFFAGQLLTEDDLQNLDDYVVSKNRLHMRQLFGAGVVCGLDVTCYPCGGGKVIVNPGYALDCCGNDIVVSCSTELDINQMVRELLRKQRGGFDCGDPCAGTQQTTTQTSSQPSAVSGTVVASSSDTTSTKTADCVHKYCLYIDYCEKASDPVAPYATDDPCGSTSCETTRIREGFRFELRCPPATYDPGGICGSITNCVGDQTALDTAGTINDGLERRVVPLGDALRRYKATAIPVIQATAYDEVADAIAQHAQAFEKVFTQSSAPAVPASAAAEAPAPSSSSTNTEAPDLETPMFDFAKDLATLSLQEPDAVSQIVALLAKDLSSSKLNFDTVRQDVWTAADQMRQQASQSKSEFDLDAAYSESLAAVTQRVLTYTGFQPRSSSATPSTTPNIAARSAVSGSVVSAARNDASVLLLAQGGVFDKALYATAQKSLESMNGWLANQVERAPSKTRCGAVDAVYNAPAPRPAQDEMLAMSFAEMLHRSTLHNTTLYRRTIADCICNAINPPCSSCDDMGVLLACLTVKDCRVVDICNLERTFVLTWPTMRYWIPEISRIGAAIEQLCCPSHCEEESTTNIRGPLTYQQSQSNANATYARDILELMTLGCGVRVPRGSAQIAAPPNNLRADVLTRAMNALGAQSPAVASGSSKNVLTLTAKSTEVDELKEKLSNAQHDLSQLTREHRRLSDRMLKLERAGKKTSIPDA